MDRQVLAFDFIENTIQYINRHEDHMNLIFIYYTTVPVYGRVERPQYQLTWSHSLTTRSKSGACNL